MSEERQLSLETLAVHAGQEIDPTTMSRALPIYQTTSYGFRDTEHAANLFALKEFGNIYTRLMNPTTDVFEKRVAALEGGSGALATASGQSAITYALLNIAGAGDHIVSAASLYGGTYNLFAHTLPKIGIDVSFVDPSDPDNFRGAIKENTKAIFAETVGNPKGDIFNIEAVAKIAHENGIPLIVDNTIPTPFLLRPFEHGANVIVHSATKFIGGHGTSIGGVIVDGGNFDWAASGKFPGMTEPDASYGGLVYTEALGPIAYIIKIRVQLMRDMGAALSPFNAFQLVQGLETLHLRMERHSENALAVAKFLEQHPAVESVNYTGLPSHPTYHLVEKYMPRGQGAILTFDVKGGLENGKKVIDNVKMFSHLANIGDSKSLIIHPASTTHSQLKGEELLSTGTTPGMIRLSVGTEGIDDIIYDLDQALKASQQ